MKKEDLKTGMRMITKCGKRFLFVQTDNGGVATNIEHGAFTLDKINDNFMLGANHKFEVNLIYKGFNMDMLLHKDLGLLIWERKEKSTALTLDGVDYSESTLRSLIKKATS